MTLNWQELFNLFEIDGPDGVTCSTVAQLDAAEQKLSLKLPAEYRNYCQTFGAGEFTRPLRVQFAAPGSVDEDYDLLRFHKHSFACPFMHDEKVLIDPQLFLRAVYFANDRGGGFRYSWDTKDVTDPATHDYRI